jgi:hypothetical protein
MPNIKQQPASSKPQPQANPVATAEQTVTRLHRNSEKNYWLSGCGRRMRRRGTLMLRMPAVT